MNNELPLLPKKRGVPGISPHDSFPTPYCHSTLRWNLPRYPGFDKETPKRDRGLDNFLAYIKRPPNITSFSIPTPADFSFSLTFHFFRRCHLRFYASPQARIPQPHSTCRTKWPPMSRRPPTSRTARWPTSTRWALRPKISSGLLLAWFQVFFSIFFFEIKN